MVNQKEFESDFVGVSPMFSDIEGVTDDKEKKKSNQNSKGA